MNGFLKPGKDMKYCTIKQDNIKVIFPYSAEKREPQHTVAMNTRIGFNPVADGKKTSQQIEKIGLANTQSQKQPVKKGDPRGTTISLIGNAGDRIEIDAMLTGDYYVQRNKLLKIIHSGRPCSIYLTRYQTLGTSGKLSSVNEHIRARDGVLATILPGSYINETHENIAGCTVRIVAQEVKDTSREQKKTVIGNYLDKALDIIENVATKFDDAKTFLTEINGYLTQALGVISNLGSEINDIVLSVSYINDNIDNLLQTPSLLKAQYASVAGNIKNLGNKISNKKGDRTQNDINNQKNLYKFAKNLAVYKSSTPPSETKTNINNASLINVDNIKQNLVNGKLINFNRYNGFGLMLSIAQNSFYGTADEVDSMIASIKDTYSFIAGDTSYNGVVSDEIINTVLTEDARDREILSILYNSMHTVLIQLRSIKQNLSNQSYITSTDTNIWNIISEKYMGLVQNGTTLSSIAENLYVANNMSSYNDIIPANTKIFLPTI